MLSGNIWVAVREGRVKRNEIADRAKEFVRAEYLTNHNAWGPLSLDVPLSIETNATLLDRLSTEGGTGVLGHQHDGIHRPPKMIC